MTDCTNAGSLSRANSALGGQSSMQLVYGLGTAKSSAMRSCGRKKSANTRRHRAHQPAVGGLGKPARREAQHEVDEEHLHQPARCAARV